LLEAFVTAVIDCAGLKPGAGMKGHELEWFEARVKEFIESAKDGETHTAYELAEFFWNAGAVYQKALHKEVECFNPSQQSTKPPNLHEKQKLGRLLHLASKTANSYVEYHGPFLGNGQGYDPYTYMPPIEFKFDVSNLILFAERLLKGELM
jgi:hypothetical protein